MRDRIRYQNAAGATIDLNDGNFMTNPGDLRSFEWTATVTGRPDGLGGRIKRVSRPSCSHRLRVGVRGTREQFEARMNALHALTEADVVSGKTGRLWLNDQYLPCMITVSSVTVYARSGAFGEKELTLLSPEPFWYTEVVRTFTPVTGAITAGKKYPLRYPYRFGTGYSSQTLYNTHYTDTPVRIVFFGPVTSPEITIAGHRYAVQTTLLENERVEVDPLERTVTKIGASGDRINLFNLRDKTSDLFAPVPAGNSVVQFESMTFQITLIQRRSEPLWE